MALMTEEQLREYLKKNPNARYTPVTNQPVQSQRQAVGSGNAITNILARTLLDPFARLSEGTGALTYKLGNLLTGDNVQYNPLMESVLGSNVAQQVAEKPLREGLAKGTAGIAALGVGGGVSKGLTGIQKALALAKTGGISGTLAGFGGSESGKGIESAIKGGLTGAAIGGGLGLASGLFGKKAAEVTTQVPNRAKSLIRGTPSKLGMTPEDFDTTRQNVLQSMQEEGFDVMGGGVKKVVNQYPKYLSRLGKQVESISKASNITPDVEELTGIYQEWKDVVPKTGISKQLITQLEDIVTDPNPSMKKLVDLKKFADKKGGLFKSGPMTEKATITSGLAKAIRDEARSMMTGDKVLNDRLSKLSEAMKIKKIVMSSPEKTANWNLPFGIKVNLQPAKDFYSSARLPQVSLPEIPAVDNIAGLGARFAGPISQYQPTQELEQPLIPEGITQDNMITNQMVGQGQLPADRAEIYPQSGIGQAMQSSQTSPSQSNQQKLMTIMQIFPEASISEQLALMEVMFPEATGTGGKTLPAGALEDLANSQEALALLPELEGLITESGSAFGPLEGPLRGLNPWDKTGQGAKSTIQLVKQIIGKGLEGGVLRKEDEYKYERILPKLGDTESTVANKIDLLKRTLGNKYETLVQTYQMGGYNPYAGTSDMGQTAYSPY